MDKKGEYESREEKLAWELEYLRTRTQKLYDFASFVLEEFDEEFEEFSDGSAHDISQVRMELEEIISEINHMSGDADHGEINRKRFKKIKQGFEQVKMDFEDLINDTEKTLAFEFTAIQQDLKEIYHENNDLHQ